jgi:hypothetical protein
VEFTVVGPPFFKLFLRHDYQNTYKKSTIQYLKILSDEKLRPDIGFNLRPTRALHIILQRSNVDFHEDQKSSMD